LTHGTSTGSYPYTAQVWAAIKSLRSSVDGLPSGNYRHLEAGLILWIVAGRQVVYQRLDDLLRVTVVKPLE
jgi:hypothetical protein